MYCTNCGRKIDDNALFCPYCGQKVLNTSQNMTENQKPYQAPMSENPENYQSPFHVQNSENDTQGTYQAPFNDQNIENDTQGSYERNSYMDNQGNYNAAYTGVKQTPRTPVEPWQALTYVGCFFLLVSFFLPFKSISYSSVDLYRSYDFNIFSYSYSSYLFFVSLPLLCYFTSTKRNYLDLFIVCGVNVILFLIPAIKGHSTITSIVISYDFGFFLGILALLMSIAGPVMYMLEIKKYYK